MISARVSPNGGVVSRRWGHVDHEGSYFDNHRYNSTCLIRIDDDG